MIKAAFSPSLIV